MKIQRGHNASASFAAEQALKEGKARVLPSDGEEAKDEPIPPAVDFDAPDSQR